MVDVILLSDERISAIPVTDNGEELLDLRAVPEIRLDTRLADDAGAFAMLRQQVLSRLLAAQSTLPGGLRLLVIEAYRPLDRQRHYFESYRDKLATLHPQWSRSRCAGTGQCCRKPSSPPEW